MDNQIKISFEQKPEGWSDGLFASPPSLPDLPLLPMLLSFLGGDSPSSCRSIAAKSIEWSAGDVAAFKGISMNPYVRAWVIKVSIGGFVPDDPPRCSGYVMEVSPVIPADRWDKSQVGFEYLFGFDEEGKAYKPLARLKEFDQSGFCGEGMRLAGPVSGGWIPVLLKGSPDKYLPSDGEKILRWVATVLTRGATNGVDLFRNSGDIKLGD